MTSVSTIIGGGFALIRNHPRAVAIWALIHIVTGLATQFLMRAQIQSMGLLDGGAPDPEAVIRSMGWMIPTQILNFAVWVMSIVIACAAYRLVLRPREPGYAGMRIGMDEVRVFGTGLILVIAVTVVLFVAMLLGMMIALATGAFVRDSAGIAGLVIALLVIALLVGSIFVWVRLSVALPLTFALRKIGIDDSWKLTRGHFWTLFAAYLVIGLIVIVAALAVSFPYLAVVLQSVRDIAYNPGAAEEIQRQQMLALFGGSWWMMLGLTVLGGIAQALIAALTNGATATAARTLLADAGIVLEDDAEAQAAIFE
ncbi:MAG: hypothetical protein ACAH11_13495 [Sphingomonas sp.]